MSASTQKPLIAPWKITLMAVAGTLVPAIMVAFAFAVAPLPVTPAAADVLRQLVRMAGVFIGLNALIVAVVTLINALASRPARGRPLAVRT
ncbi:hypothetical protein [Ramlibacter sp.]|uniref:hypothetical protein n=1 Tax=Ramlibacter sp. TaxID=1917967 RepID=UPI0035B44678